MLHDFYIACSQKAKKAERVKRQKEEEKAIQSGLEPPPRKQQKVRGEREGHREAHKVRGKRRSYRMG